MSRRLDPTATNERSITCEESGLSIGFPHATCGMGT